MKAKNFYSGFGIASDAYNGISCASDGNIYYVLSSASLERGGQMYCYDPANDEINFLGDLTEICGEKPGEAIPQGKTHVDFYEWNGKLFFSSHVGFYENINGMERMPVNSPAGYKLYPGAHIISFDLLTRKFENLATIPDGEGIITLTMDLERSDIYAITWPHGNFIHYETGKAVLKNLGPVSAAGEYGIPGVDFSVLCRSMFVDPRDGYVYFSTSDGNIYYYNPDSGKINIVEGANLRLDYFGSYDITIPGSMGYNWRKIFWYPAENVAYGVHGNSGYLFRFDTTKPKIEIVERITSLPSRRSGMYDKFVYGYLGFQLGADGQTIYYLTGGPLGTNGKSVNLGNTEAVENIHLVTFNIPERKYFDHGVILFEDFSIPRAANSIAIDPAGNVYSLAGFLQNGKIIHDLVKIQNPFIRPNSSLIQLEHNPHLKVKP